MVLVFGGVSSSGVPLPGGQNWVGFSGSCGVFWKQHL